MTNEEAIDCIDAIHVQMFNSGNSKWTEACDMAIEALKETERNPTVTSWHDFDRGYNIAKEKFARPHGEWICEGAMADYTNVLVYRCSICEEHFTGHEEDKKTWHFCPNCGASMSEEGDEE